ncbi:UDP-N-acetylglucosamine 2-epimerase (non-hydrolyzing) [Luteimonas sp. 8-5]|uniref:non-hydrolyzing UDP-N-acetylglucosamine 2-epimerase n=1 Tax=Luteimonas sp. 8-5 TaxID=3039387 RepID=UPI002436B3B9|nr:UDP-N-acetylglucosamine 2-epimerase (non-hydrolyzing) [Luteimonas sp. 8-5]MDG6348294.1 UDP-N-acetylglucosamine 2-epimerase (non-hydrolyzing) [Luteimonas sp. 8-5]
MTVVGARPQFVKAAAVSRALARTGGFDEIMVHTGQHYDDNMSSIFFEEMEIPRPRYNLGIGGGGHGAMTGRQLEQLERVILEQHPDLVLVYGDTNSTLAGALAAAKLHVPIAHVEAGLRSYNRRMPEEINRVLTDHLSDILFAPTETARQNLRLEGITHEGIHVVGDVMYDATIFYRERAREPSWFPDLSIEREAFVLCTIHRAENVDDPSRLQRILSGLRDADLPVLLPIHPRTRARIAESMIEVGANIVLCDPVGYLEMTWLEANCAVVATDSGGVQKEAYFHGKHCVTLRDETEWVELVSLGVNVLVGADSEKIRAAIVARAGKPTVPSVVYGRGHAAGKVAEVLL